MYITIPQLVIKFDITVTHVMDVFIVRNKSYPCRSIRPLQSMEQLPKMLKHLVVCEHSCAYPFRTIL